MKHYKIKTAQGEIAVNVLAPHKFGGEYKRNTALFLMIVWLATIWSLIWNLSEALLRKTFISRKEHLIRILWDMGRNEKHFSCFFGDRLSKYNHKAKTDAASWRALDLFYNYHEKVLPCLKNDIAGMATKFWIGRLENRQAVTNRLKIVISSLVEAFQKVDKPEIRILSIASGSAIAVIRAMQQCPEHNIQAVLIDIDTTAINEAKKEAEKAGFADRFSFVLGSTSVIEEVVINFNPHIIEMCGFLDYRPQKQAISLIKRIWNILPQGGVFVTCNIRKNRERFLLTWALLWPMIYRNEEQFVDVLVSGGFTPHKAKVIYEPFMIHGIGICEK